jgi:hypothetical protein
MKLDSRKFGILQRRTTIVTDKYEVPDAYTHVDNFWFVWVEMFPPWSRMGESYNILRQLLPKKKL